MKALMDANVCLDILLKRNPELGEKIISQAEEGNISLYVSTSIVHILAYWTNKKFGFEIARELLLYFLDIVEILDLPHKESIQATAMADRDMEDSIQLRVAMFHSLDFIITNDLKFMKDSSLVLPIISPETFLNQLTSNQ